MTLCLYRRLYKIGILLYIMFMIAVLIILAIFLFSFIALILIYNSKTKSFSTKHREKEFKELDKQFKEGKISKEDFIELRKKI